MQKGGGGSVNDGIGTSQKQLNIALDFDDTITADPVLWRQFAELARSRGHKVFVVTLRGGEKSLTEAEEYLEQHGYGDIDVWGTAFKSKLRTMKQLGVRVDIWIDDHPERLVNGL